MRTNIFKYRDALLSSLETVAGDPFQLTSRRRVLRGGIVAAACLATTACIVGYGKGAPPPLTGLGWIALSPDGRIVAVVSNNPTRFVLYDWRTGEITYVPQSPVWKWRVDSPSFSPDGETLAVTQGHAGNTGLALMQLRTYEVTQLPIVTPNDLYRNSPRFSPNGRQLAFAASRIAAPAGIVLQDITGTNFRELLDPAFGFYEATDLCFIAPGEIIFQGRAPRDKRLAELVAAMGHSPTDRVQYRLVYGETPAAGFAMPEPLHPQLDTRRGLGLLGDGVSGLCASFRGAVFAWTGFSLSAPDVIASGGYDVFERREGPVNQITRRNTYTHSCAISNDGSTIAFTEDMSRGTDFDLTISDRRTNGVIVTNLLAKLRGEHRA